MADEKTSINIAEFVQDLGIPVLLLAILAMMMVPLPPLALDALFTFNIALSLGILLTTIYVKRPLDFGVFPTVLLVVTLLRLALNIASTRIVLLNGHSGTSAAGQVIEAFGEFVVGGACSVRSCCASSAITIQTNAKLRKSRALRRTPRSRP